MELLLLSFFAGVLTVLAPCVFPLLPVIIGGSVGGTQKYRPLIITLSLATSLVLFTLILKASSAAFAVPTHVWKWISGGIVLAFGLTYLFPTAWQKVCHICGLEQKSQASLQASNKQGGFWGMVGMGASLGPVFASCSPTYGLIIATVLPASFAKGIVYLISYALGLAAIMFLVAYFGQRAVARLRWATDPRGAFRKVLGVIFVLVGLSVITGYDKKIEAAAIDAGYLDLTQFEYALLDDVSVK